MVLAAAAAIGAEPSPASFENTPLAMPVCITIIIEPIAPPVTARGLKAPSIMILIAKGIAVTFVTMSTTTLAI